MNADQRAIAVPGFFGCTNCVATDCGSPASQEARMRDKLQAYMYVTYLQAEPRMVGLVPWDLDNRHAVGCNIERKPKCNDCDMKVGAESFPQLLRDWKAFGASIVRGNNSSTVSKAK